MSSPALTVIGLDSATFDVVDPMLAAGELPHLARLSHAGARGVLRSTTHPLTPHAWATIVTGVNAGRHGIWDFTERDESGYQLRLVNGSFRKAPAVWDRLRRSGRRAGIVNIPFTWPAPRVDGFSIAGFDAAAREEGLTHPESLRAELRQRYGSLELDNKFPVTDGKVDLGLARRAAEQKLEIVESLTDRFEPELLFVVFMAADHVHHICWDAWEADGLSSPVADVYRILDDAVGRLVELTGLDGNVVVISDHGAGKLNGVVNLNAWLESQGLLAYEGGAATGKKLLGEALALRRHLPRRLRYAAKQRLPGLREQAQLRSDYTVVDWSRTKAFAYGTFGNIVVNVRGREREGIVEPGDEYERTRSEIAERLLDLRSPEGEAIVAEVHRREDLFHGPEIDKVPDLLVEFRDYAWLGKGSLKARSRSLWDEIEIDDGGDLSYVGSHRHEGIAVLAGPAVAAGAQLSGGLLDVAPTLLYLLGEKIPSDLEGRVLVEALRQELLDERQPEYDDAAPAEFEPERAELQAEGAAEVERRLRGLGYLD
ncbi:MAG TPA: alkaline phosphatase family protein [Gaiellaceae bacterium]|nr:alkaline phosphatase family protein [Gaiellaceae bacterium]